MGDDQRHPCPVQKLYLDNPDAQYCNCCDHCTYTCRLEACHLLRGM